MPIASTRAFVLGSNVFNEQDKLVHLLTVDRGILKAVAPGSMKVRNRFGSLFELFTEGEFHYYWKENREMVTISRGEIVNSYFNIVSESKNIFYFSLISEVLLRFVPYNNKDEKIYRLVVSILKHRKKGIEMDQLLLYFFIWILRIEGIMFNPGICYNCFDKNIQTAWVKTDFRGTLCQKCRTDENFVLKKQELEFIKWTETHSPEDLGFWKGKIDIAKIIRLFKQKIENHAECSLKSSIYLPEFK